MSDEPTLRFYARKLTRIASVHWPQSFAWIVVRDEHGYAPETVNVYRHEYEACERANTLNDEVQAGMPR